LYKNYVTLSFGTAKIENFIHKSDKKFTYKSYLNKDFSNIKIENLEFNLNYYNLNIANLKYTSLIELYKNLFKRCHIFLYEDLESNFDNFIQIFRLKIFENLNYDKKIQKIVNNYYTEDNFELKKRLPNINWETYRGKYL